MHERRPGVGELVSEYDAEPDQAGHRPHDLVLRLLSRADALLHQPRLVEPASARVGESLTIAARIEASTRVTRAVANVTLADGTSSILTMTPAPDGGDRYQATLPLARFIAEAISPALGSRDLLVFDQRGTGASNRLRCAAFESPSLSLVQAVTSCANQLGPARGFFRAGSRSGRCFSVTGSGLHAAR